MSKQQQFKKALSAVRSGDKIAELKELLAMVNDGMSKAEFNALAKQMFRLISDIDKKLSERVDTKTQGKNEEFTELMAKFSQLIDDTKKENYHILSGVQQRITNLFTGFFTKNEIDKKMRELDSKIAELNRLIDENKVDKEELSGDILSKIPKYDNDIEKLREDLKKNGRLKGGGTSAIGVKQAFKYIAHTEKPVGTINGTNKVFTVSKTIFWIAGFTISNQQIAELTNFTYTGNTITFDQAIPASYATRDFEIKYIG